MAAPPIDLHLVSDATGETLNSIARATTAQFEQVQIVYHRWSLIRTRFQLHRVLEGIEAEPGPVLSTLVDKALRADLETTCQRLDVQVINVLDPVMALLQDKIGAQATARPGRQYVLDADYFRRIDAMHYVLAHDDGQSPGGYRRGRRGAGGRVSVLQDPDLFLSCQSRGEGGERAAGAQSARPARAREPILPR